MATKDIYFEGELVGQIEAADDPLIEHQRAEDLLVTLGLQRAPLTPAAGIWRQAVHFRRTGEFLINAMLHEKVRRPFALIPAVVIYTFAIELYLKALLLASGSTSPPQVHKLDELFDRLPLDVRDRVEALASEYGSANWRRAVKARDALSEMRTSFVDWRYAHEKKAVASVQPGKLHMLLDVLQTSCEERDPAITPLPKLRPYDPL
jgi:hypothetical protein